MESYKKQYNKLQDIKFTELQSKEPNKTIVIRKKSITLIVLNITATSAVKMGLLTI
jgi:hypothetical protein